ncbi:DUF1223 domain-containing protein [Nitratireductor thuwali]|uniref:DUF1223 domain-containing protein n=1 Tax=Nitratireductor thuwali TaxID=2267699 RepID=A0ABY5MHD1_9HYPH|nr:hypothetical protein NTH_01870 [Nitratireductor thuwali]
MKRIKARLAAQLAGLTLTALCLAPMAGAAAEKVRVVELFTSQGCSSCPPADAFLAELAERDDLVALAYHVDYWDYLGWRDRLGSPENSARQRGYAQKFDSSVYTPQMVINGRTHVVGSKRPAVLTALESETSEAVDVTITEDGNSLAIDIGSAVGDAKDAHVVLVYYEPRKRVTIGAGENSGRTIEYRNIVTEYRTIGMWHGKATRLEMPMSEIAKWGSNCAVLLQSVDKAGRPGPILGAARAGS